MSETRTSIYSLFIVCSFLIYLYRFKKFYFSYDFIDRNILFATTISLFLIIILTIIGHYIQFNSITNINDFLSGRIGILSTGIENININKGIENININNEAFTNDLPKSSPNHNHNILLDLLTGFYNPIYIFFIVYLYACLFISLRKKDLLLFTFLSFVLIASLSDMVWRIDRLDIITVFLATICLIRKPQKNNTIQSV